jgi:glucosamine--fructose-6-phosphate aminotransferase (isomerizing)
LQSFLDTARALPESLPSIVKELGARAHRLLSMQQIYGLRQVILTGNGDSFVATSATAPAFRAWTGLPVQALPAMETSRYVTVGVTPQHERLRGALIVCVSHSGEAIRTIEAAKRCRQAGALTIAVTAHSESRLARTAEIVFQVGPHDSSSAPGTVSYFVSLLALYFLGIRIAEARMRLSMNIAAALRNELTHLVVPLRSAISVCEGPLDTIGQEWAHFRTAHVLGSGPSAGAAAFIAAKLIEAVGVNATSQDIEEFFHLGYFVLDDHELPTIVVAPARSMSSTRAQDAVHALCELKRPHLLLTDDLKFVPTDKRVVLPVIDELLVPLLCFAPAILLAASWAQRVGETRQSFLRERWKAADGARRVRQGAIEPLPKEC